MKHCVGTSLNKPRAMRDETPPTSQANQLWELSARLATSDLPLQARVRQRPAHLQYRLIAEEVGEAYSELVAYEPDSKPYTVKY